MKKRNTRFGCPRIAQQINKAFGLNIDKDVVRRVLVKHYRPKPSDGGPSWLTFFRHTVEKLRSISLFQRNSMLRHIVSSLIAIGQHTRRIIACGIAGCRFDQTVLCSLFAAGTPVVEASKSLWPDHDPLFSHYRCRRTLLDVDRLQRPAMFPRASPYAKRRIRIRRRKPHGYRSNRTVIDRETEHAVLNNDRTLFLMPGSRNEIGSSKINRERTLIAA